MADHSDQLTAAALRIYGRYAVEIVEAFHLCPWAARARRDGRVRTIVLTDAAPGDAAVDAQIDCVAAAPDVEVGLLIFPRLAITRPAMRRWVSAREHAHAARHPAGSMPLAMAAFHPEAPPSLDSAAKLVGFLRRSPDPTIQLVRRDVLARARRTRDEGSSLTPPSAQLAALFGAAAPVATSEAIAHANLATVQRVGVATLEAIFADIQRDRADSYARAVAASSVQ